MAESSTKRKRIEEDSSSAAQCPYLDTINTRVLDFDFEKICSVTLKTQNVYCCLVCGKFFQGRSTNSPVYTHAIEENHCMYLNLHTHRVYCCPDNYEVPVKGNKLLEDIGKPYIPGYLGLNSMKETDYINVVVQALAHIPPIRDFFLEESNYKIEQRALASQMMQTMIAFGELTRKLWNPRSFKAQVSPHEFVQRVITASNRRFTIAQKGDPLDFLIWMVNGMKAEHKYIYKGGLSKDKKSITDRCFQGMIRINTTSVDVKSGSETGDCGERENPFMFLSVDLDPKLVLKQERRDVEDSIAQIPLMDLLQKYNGKMDTEVAVKAGTLERRKYTILSLPDYLIIRVARFQHNKFFREKLRVVVTHPVKGLDLRELVGERERESAVYDLAVSISHEGDATTGHYHAHVRQRPQNAWVRVSDLTVEPIMPELMTLAEAYVLVYERRKP